MNTNIDKKSKVQTRVKPDYSIYNITFNPINTQYSLAELQALKSAIYVSKINTLNAKELREELMFKLIDLNTALVYINDKFLTEDYFRGYAYCRKKAIDIYDDTQKDYFPNAELNMNDN